MIICCPFRQRYFHGIRLGLIGPCILMPMAALKIKNKNLFNLIKILTIVVK